MDGDSFQERQDGERAVLKSIYHNEIQEIKKKEENSWTPLECILTLGPQTCEQPSCNAPKVDLHIVCSYEYPKELPEIKLEKWKKISNYKISVLEKELNDVARKRQGEVMIHELAQYTMDFLADNYIENGNMSHSFYEEMMARIKKDEERELQNRKANEEKIREKMLIEFNTTQAALKKALRRRHHSDKTVEEDQEKIPDKGHKIDLNSSNQTIGTENSQFDEIPGINICPDDDYTWNLPSNHSRFENEFEHIKRLGKGAFGDVLKVRNKLDDGHYAVKKIKLNPSENKLNRKTIREAKLLSRLNHENVVRYYNSWIETTDESKTLPVIKKNKNPVLKNLNQRTLDLLPHNENNFDWDVDKTSESTDEESSDDYILFKSLSNDTNKLEGIAPESTTSVTEENGRNENLSVQYLYIQMELCDKSTLRIAIDDNLYSDVNKVWRLFREIVEGLCHIHQQGIIHRDLKPVNIFIGYDEHVKIGDFGLATTIALQKQTVRDIGQNMEVNDRNDVNIAHPHSDVSRTGQVGTTLYRAPELNNSTSAKFPYTQKVDIYSLGIILFEMCHPPFKTGMERCGTITDLRQEDPVFPDDFKYDEDLRRIIKKMLNYDVKERPTSQQLLQSPFLPPPKMEEAEVKDKVRMTLLKPQSKDYKYLIASCFNQSIPPTLDATYNIYSWRSGWFTRSLETVSGKLRTIFQHHGATSFLPPLLTPAEQTCDAAVCLMTRLGTIVYATHDLQMPFARYLAHNPNVTYLKRYALDKVYRERPAGIHPKEIYQAAFDIVTPALGGLMPEYEMLCVIWKILSEFPNLRGKNLEVHLNHSYLISAMLKHSGLDELTQDSICMKIFKMKNNHTRQETYAFLQSLGLPKRSVSSLTNWMEITGSLNKVRSLIEVSVRNDEVSSLIEIGLQQLGVIINFCKIIGVCCPVIINLGFIKNAHQYSGIMFQVLLDQRNKVKGLEHLSILNGGRYDNLIGKLRKILPRNEGKVNQFVTGFTLSIDKLIASLDNENKPSITEVLVCAMGDIIMTPDKLVLLKDLWKSGIKTSFLNTMHSLEEIQEHCREVGITVIVLLKESEPGFARIRTITKDKYFEKKVQYNELIDYIKKNNSNDLNSVCKPELKSMTVIEGPNITFVINDKLSPVTKRRYESQILNNLSRVFQRFSTQTKIEILALLIEADVIKSIEYNTDDSSNNDQELNTLVKKYPRHKKIFHKIKDLISDLKQSVHTFVVILYNVTDNVYKILM